MPNQSASWFGGRTYVFQGTVGEDATAGTHVASLTVTPGAGNEFLVLYGKLVEGATATAQVTTIQIDDGTNGLSTFFGFVSDTSTGISHSFPTPSVPAANTNTVASGASGFFSVSGAMRLIMQVSTTAVSVTHTFSLVLRVFGDSPTFTLADTVGTPTLTTNTSGFF